MLGAVGAAVVYGPAKYHPVSDEQPTADERAFYNGLSKLGWSLAVSWVILACVKAHWHELGATFHLNWDRMEWSG